MIRLIIDESVLFDFVGERRETCALRDKLCAIEMAGWAELWSTAFCFERLIGDMRDQGIPEEALGSSLEGLLEFVGLCSFDAPDVLAAVAGGLDFQTAALAVCRDKVKADRIITFDEDRICALRGAALTPEAYFRELEQDQGMYFEFVEF